MCTVKVVIGIDINIIFIDSQLAMVIIDINIIVIITAGGGSEGHDLRRLKEVIIRPKIFVEEMILSGGYLWKGVIL